MKNIIIIVVIIGVGIGFSLCHKPSPLNTEEETNVSKDFNEMEVKDHFQWKTLKDIQVSLSSTQGGVVYIKSLKGDVYMKGFLAAATPFDTKITIPTYVTEVDVVCEGQSRRISVADKKLMHHFN